MALTEKEKSARLRLIQLAAAHVLRLHVDDETPFRASEAFPDQVRPSETTASEYTWRQQLAWTWARAHFLKGSLTGQGLQKSTVYTVTPLGVEALMRIASEPVLASFYVSQKRTTAITQGYTDPDVFRPFELRTEQLGAALTPEDEEPEDAPDDDGESAPADDEVWTEETGDAGEGAKPSATAAEAAQLGVFFERSIAVLENMNTKLSRFDARMETLENEVKAQSTLVLELAAKFEGAASRDDVAEAAANLIASTVRERDADRVATARELASMSEAICNGLGHSMNMLDASVVGSVETLTADIGKLRASVDALAKVKPVSAAKPADVDLSPLIVILSRVETALGALHDKVSAPSESTTDVGVLDERLEEVGEQIKDFRAQISELEGIYTNWADAREASTVVYGEAMTKIAETAHAVLDGAKYVAGALIELSLKTARHEGVTANEAEKSVQSAISTFGASQEAIKNRTSALGAGLLHMLNQPQTPLVLRPADQDGLVTTNVRVIPADLATALKIGGAK